MAAFQEAYRAGADMIELDVQLSKDRVPVVFHDTTLDRLTNVSGKVSSYTFRELKKVNAGHRFHKSFAVTPIPSLEEVLGWAAGKMAVNIEIKKEAVGKAFKSSGEAGIEQLVVDMVNKYRMQDVVLISSFAAVAVSRIKQMNPGISTGLLFRPEKRSGRELHPLELMEKYNADCFHCHWMELKARWLTELKQENIPVFVYTINSRRRMRTLIADGVTGIFTDRPDRLLDVVKEMGM